MGFHPDLGQKKESLGSLFHLIVCPSEGQMVFQGLDVQKWEANPVSAVET